MDYAQKKAIFQKILIVSTRSPNPIVAREDEKRFRRFSDILSEAGFEPMQACAGSIAELSGLADRFKPDIIFCAPDHLPETGRSSLESGIEPPRVNVHSWLERRGIPYVGSPPDVIELALSKTALKDKWMMDGISTPAYRSIDSSSEFSSIEASSLPPFPCIVKPADAGNSRGITKDSVVFDMKSLEKAVAILRGSFGHILIEHYLGLYPDFREITCACIGNGEERLLMPAELVFLEPARIHVITTEDKDGHKTEALAIENEALREGAVAFAKSALLSAGVRDYSRCDLAFAGGRFWAIEVNGQPMIPDPWFEACAVHAGLDEKRYILAIVRAAIKRTGGERCSEFPDTTPLA